MFVVQVESKLASARSIVDLGKVTLEFLKGAYLRNRMVNGY